jgi:hypothetical protein
MIESTVLYILGLGDLLCCIWLKGNVVVAAA